MKKLLKQALSLALAVLMVLAMVPAMPLVADAAENFEVGETLKLNGTLPSEFKKFETVNFKESFIYVGNETYNWSVFVSGTAGTKFHFGASIKKSDGTSVQSVNWTERTIGTNGQVTLFNAANFTKLTAAMLGDFILTVQLKYNETVFAQMTVKFSRITDKVNYDANWTYANGFEFINGAFNTDDEDYIFEGNQNYDWTVTVNSTLSASVRIDATIERLGDSNTLTASKQVTIPADEEFELFNYTAFPSLTNKLTGNFKLTCNIVYKLNGKDTVVAQLVAVFGRSSAITTVDPVEPIVVLAKLNENGEYETLEGIKWSSCSYPPAIGIYNDGDYSKLISAKAEIAMLDGSTKTVNFENVVEVGGLGIIATGAQMMSNIIKDTPGVYSVTVSAYWNNDKNTTVTESVVFEYLEHNKETIPGKAPTCTETGLTDGEYCTNCDYLFTKQEEIPVADHNYVDGTCTACGATAAPELLNFISSTTVALNNSVALQFVIDPDLDDDGTLELIGEDNYVVINKLNRETGEWEFYSNVPQGDWETYTKGRNVAVCDLAAMQMTDQFKVVLYSSNGEQISKEWIDSGRAYGMRAVNTLINQTDDASKKLQLTMFIDFLNYCAAAQIQFGYYTDDLTNSELTDAHQAYATASVAPENLRSGVGSSQVNVEARIELSFLFPQDLVTQEMRGVITYAHFDGVEESVTIQGADFDTYTNKNDVTFWKLPAPNIATPDGNQIITCIVYDANGNEIAKAQDSVNSYMARVLASSGASDNLKALATAAVKLTTSSNNYFNK